VNKTSLILEVVNRTGIDKRQVEPVVNAVLDVVRDAVASGERVTLAGFGSFERQRRSARVGRNPHTGEAVKIPATSKPVFRPGNVFRQAVAGRRRRAKTTRKRVSRR
jgi:DNA-binding protein HU-beta